MNEQSPAPLPQSPDALAEQNADKAATEGKWEQFAPRVPTPVNPEKTAEQAMKDFEAGDQDLHDSIDRWVSSAPAGSGEEMASDPRYAVNNQEASKPDESQTA